MSNTANVNRQKTPAMRNLVGMILLMVCTFGIYFLYWVYKTTEYANRDEREPHHSPVAQLLLVMFIPYYELYWFYKTSKKLSHIGETVNLHDDNSLVTLILGIFALDLIGTIILQDQINQIETVSNGEEVTKKGKAIWLAVPIAILGFLLILGIVAGLAFSIGDSSENSTYNPEPVVEESTTGVELTTATETTTVVETTTAAAVTVPNGATVAQDSTGNWALVNGGTTVSTFTGIASNGQGKWYIENGYVNFTYSGIVVYNGTSYNVENGKVIS